MSTTNDLERRIRELERENADLRDFALGRELQQARNFAEWRARRLSREHGYAVVPVLVRGEYKYFRKRERSTN